MLTIEDVHLSRERGYLAPETVLYTMYAARERQLREAYARIAELEAKLRYKTVPIEAMKTTLEKTWEWKEPAETAEVQLAGKENHQ